MRPNTLSREELTAIDACSRAANYLTVGQIYLQVSPTPDLAEWTWSAR